MSVVAGALWRAVVPPFRALDPGLRRAEGLLGGALSGVCAALPDESLAAARLNAVLAGLGAQPRLRVHRGGWQLTVAAGGLDGRPDRDVGTDRDAEAACALAVLVAATGWGRLKRCGRCGCAFLDRTAAATRRGCDRHLARAPARSPSPFRRCGRAGDAT